MASPTRHRTRLAREERREQIVDAAAKVFSGRDPAEVTFEEIADAAGVSRALVYNYFGDRHGLLEAVYLRNVAILRRRVVEALRVTPGLRAALAAAVRVHLDFARENPSAYRYASGEVGFARLPELEEERIGEVAELFGGSREAKIVVAGLVAALQAMVLHWLDTGSRDPDRAADLITAFLSRGMSGLADVGLAFTPTWTPPARGGTREA